MNTKFGSSNSRNKINYRAVLFFTAFFIKISAPLKNVLALIIVFIINLTVLIAQEYTGIYDKHIVSEKKAIKYQNVRESDVQWAKTVWRRVDITEKNNLCLYYPHYPMEDRKSLVQVINYGLTNSSIKAYHSDNFIDYYSVSDLDIRYGAKLEKIMKIDTATGETVPEIIKEEADYSEVREILIKEIWFIDKQRSVLDFRIVGIAPIRLYYKSTFTQTRTPYLLYWINYSEARSLFAQQPVYNKDNNAATLSFDDYFLKHNYEGYIFQEDNVYDDRLLIDYLKGINIMLESNIIKQKITNYKQQLWEF